VLETSTPTASRTYTLPGTYTANLRVRDQLGATSAPSSLRIDAGNTPPTATIQTPAAGQRFRVGETVALGGSASDAEDGTLAPSQLSWEVRRHHDAHWHPFLPPTSGNDVPITTPAPEDLLAATNSFLEIRLTATDSKGLSTTVTRQFDPRKVDLTFATSPAGRRVTVNGSSLTGPQTVVSWEAYQLNVDAPAQVDGSGQAWQWQAWSDGGAKAHAIVTPAAPATYTAAFERGSAVRPGLVAAYNFDEGAGTIAADLSGNGNTASLSGAAWTPAGKNAGAISFDGTDDSLSIADAPTLDLTAGMTLSAWVRPTGGSTYRTVLFKERTGGLAYALYAQTGGNGPSGHAWIGGAEPRARATSQIAGSTWTHLAATYDGADIRLYVGGVLAVSAPATGPIGTSTGPLRIGGNGVVSEWFGGQIDDVRVYDRALTPEEIEADRDTPVGLADTTPPGTSIDSGPSGTWAATSSSFSFSADEAPATFECRLDGGAWAACTSPRSYGVLVPGAYVFEVRARDGTGNLDPTPASRAVRVARPFTADLDDDTLAEPAVWRPSSGAWHRPGVPAVYFGRDGDVPVPGQYDADAELELAVWRPVSGGWYVPGSAAVFYGLPEDVPVPADYDGDGETDVAVWRPSGGAWLVQGGSTTFFGQAGDVPLPGQWDVDAPLDLAVFRPSTGGWHVQGSPTVVFGTGADVPVPADFDGDGALEPAVFRPATGEWRVLGLPTVFFGLGGDVPVAGQWDADPEAERAVWRPSNGGWFVQGSPTVFLGRLGDVP
jgi:Concanavalin A-like lectin/glucanases superfamily